MNLSALKAHAEALGLNAKTGSKPAKEPYISALRDYFLQRDYPNGLPYEELSPMLCYDFWQLHPREQEALWKDGNDWAIQQKFNGCRLLLHFIKGNGVFAHSRETSVTTFRRKEVSRHLLFHDHIPKFTATMDCELVGPTLQVVTATLNTTSDKARLVQERTPFVIHAFDITRWGDTNLKEKRLDERLAYLTDVQHAINAEGLSNHFNFPPLHFQRKQDFYEQTIKNGGEGVVLKRLGSKYRGNSRRDRFGWIKAKRQIEFDSYVSGFEAGRQSSLLSSKVANLHFSVLTDEGPRLIAKVSNLPWDFRKEISFYDRTTGKVALDPELYGKVAHLVGQELSQRAFRLVHPRITHWRSDLKQKSCVYRSSDLELLRKRETHTNPLRVVSGNTV